MLGEPEWPTLWVSRDPPCQGTIASWKQQWFSGRGGWVVDSPVPPQPAPCPPGRLMWGGLALYGPGWRCWCWKPDLFPPIVLILCVNKYGNTIGCFYDAPDGLILLYQLFTFTYNLLGCPKCVATLTKGPQIITTTSRSPMESILAAQVSGSGV